MTTSTSRVQGRLLSLPRPSLPFQIVSVALVLNLLNDLQAAGVAIHQAFEVDHRNIDRDVPNLPTTL
jgi:hypothetical protein